MDQSGPRSSRLSEDENMPVFEAPEDDGDHAPRQSYNFRTRLSWNIYRADTPDWGAGLEPQRRARGVRARSYDRLQDETEQPEVRYKLQSMKWGLIPFWTKRNPDYGSMLRQSTVEMTPCSKIRGCGRR